jgi:hypothetical protein
MVNTTLNVNMLHHLDTLSWFRVNQSLLFLLKAAFLKKQKILILQSLFWSFQGSNLQSTALEASMLTITPPMQFAFFFLLYLYYTCEQFTACPQVFSSGGTCTLLPSLLGVHQNFWGCNVPSNSSFGGYKENELHFSHFTCPVFVYVGFFKHMK